MGGTLTSWRRHRGSRSVRLVFGRRVERQVGSGSALGTLLGPEGSGALSRSASSSGPAASRTTPHRVRRSCSGRAAGADRWSGPPVP